MNKIGRTSLPSPSLPRHTSALRHSGCGFGWSDFFFFFLGTRDSETFLVGLIDEAFVLLLLVYIIVMAILKNKKEMGNDSWQPSISIHRGKKEGMYQLGAGDTRIDEAATEGGSDWMARRRTNQNYHYESPLLLLQTPCSGWLHGEWKHDNLEPAFSRSYRHTMAGLGAATPPSPGGPPASRSPHPMILNLAESTNSTRSPSTAKGVHLWPRCWMHPTGCLEPDPEPELQRSKIDACSLFSCPPKSALAICFLLDKSLFEIQLEILEKGRHTAGGSHCPGQGIIFLGRDAFI